MTTKVVYVGNLPGDVSEKVSTHPVALLTSKGPSPCLVWWAQHAWWVGLACVEHPVKRPPVWGGGVQLEFGTVSFNYHADATTPEQDV